MRTKDGTDPLFSYAAMGWYARRYMPDGDRSAPLASPAYATLASLPPLLIQDGPHQVLLHDALRLAENAGPRRGGRRRARPARSRGRRHGPPYPGGHPRPRMRRG